MFNCGERNTIFTVCNVAYLDKVMVLAESVFKNNGIRLNVFLFDKKREVEFPTDCCKIHWIEGLEIPDFSRLAFKYTIVELSTALKPWIALRLLQEYSRVVFLDPDVMVFNDLSCVFDDLDLYPVVITPHYFTPKDNGMIDDARIMKFGAYNLGFFAVNNSQESMRFLSWWSDRCLSNAFDDAQFGIFTDQKWVTIAPCFFPSIHVSYNPGLNVAFWNLDERTISIDIDGKYMVNDQCPLLFIHFSSFDNVSPERLSKRDFDSGQNEEFLIAQLGLMYWERLAQYKNISNDKRYSYDYMSDGRYISPSLRRAYVAFIDGFPEGHDPFDGDGVVADYAVKNNLFQKNNKSHSVEGYSAAANHSFKFKLVYFVMRRILRILGPNDFMNFSRLLVFLSGYHRNRNLWKM